MIETVKLVDGTTFKGEYSNWKGWNYYRWYRVLDNGNSPFEVGDAVKVCVLAILWRKQE